MKKLSWINCILVMVLALCFSSQVAAEGCFSKPSKAECKTCCLSAMSTIGFFDPSAADHVSGVATMACLGACDYYYDGVPTGCTGAASANQCADKCGDVKSCQACCNHFTIVPDMGCLLKCAFTETEKALDANATSSNDQGRMP